MKIFNNYSYLEFKALDLKWLVMDKSLSISLRGESVRWSVEINLNYKSNELKIVLY